MFFFYLGAGAVEDCLPCPGGYYCDKEGMTGPTGKCSAGYYCPANDTTISPTPSGLKCQVGYYCPEGSAEMVPCPPGEYQDNVGQSTCIACPAGSYCTVDPVTSTPSLIDCPAYHYCPAGKSNLVIRKKCIESKDIIYSNIITENVPALFL